MADVAGSDPGELLEEHRETHRDAALAVGVVIVLQLALALVSLDRGWKLAGIPGWFWFVPIALEGALLVALVLRIGRAPVQQAGERRVLVLVVLAVIMAFNLLALGALVYALVALHLASPGQLLLEALTVWTTNVVAFGLVFWELDRGGPSRRALADPPAPDFQFPQMENPGLAVPGWRPRLADYAYVAATNALAFSPTDAMPLSVRAKALMLLESLVSSLTVLLVAARAVNILS